jgi:hypothetical protein
MCRRPCAASTEAPPAPASASGARMPAVAGVCTAPPHRALVSTAWPKRRASLARVCMGLARGLLPGCEPIARAAT